jgi:hemolysin activation/secretion protein
MKKVKQSKASIGTVGFLASALICGLSQPGVHAQTTSSAADVSRNIEQSKQELNRSLTKPRIKPIQPQMENEQDIKRLKEVSIESPLFSAELMDYWISEINRPVPGQKLNDFKAFAWTLFQSKGYLAYLSTQTQSTPEGSVLKINVVFPQVGKVSTVSTEGEHGKEFLDEVAKRFNAIYKTGMPIDIQGFENQLIAASFDLPVDLEVSLRQMNATQVDVVIHVRSLEAQAGQVLGGVLHANNYGLQQFGRTQTMGSLRLAGLTPTSELTLTTQQSSGVQYYRADYEAPWTGMATRARLYASQVESKSINTKGFSSEAGAGLTKLLATDRMGRWLASAEAANRQTKNWGSDVLTSDRVDQQIRMKLRAESANGWVDSFNNEFLLTSGRVNLDRNASDLANDSTTGLKVAGHYQKIEMNGALSHALDERKNLTGSIRWRAQAASKNLDGYNRISLGGINGIRAYTSTDGVGDQGAQLSFDLIHQVVPDVWGGLFYDVGVVKNNHLPSPNATDTGAYFLRGAGWQMGGTIEKFNWSLATAQAFGKTPGPGVWTAANTKAGDFRVNFAVSRPF